MTVLLETFLQPAAFMAGGFLGEAVAYRAFGVPKNAFVLILDIIIFIFLISLVSTYLTSAPSLSYYIVNFSIGLFSIPLVRCVEDLLSLTKRPYLTAGISIKIIKALSNTGLDKIEIARILQKIGYSQKEIGKYEAFISESVPAYLPKFIRMEKTLESIETRLDSLCLEKYLQAKKPKKKPEKTKGDLHE